jgi:alpha-ketoglutarate-dependent taurine dioxygenase
MGKHSAKTAKDSPWDLSSDRVYDSWRAEKLHRVATLLQAPMVEISDLANPTNAACTELACRCATGNIALYQTAAGAQDPDAIRAGLRGFADSLGLEIAEAHRSAGKCGIVALTVSQAPAQRGYIPYSRRPMNWHTDGYYNAPGEQIRAMVLHCVQPAHSGGRNQFFDPEIAYIRLRDHNPDFIAALMHSQAMTIPENREANGDLRPVSTGPVFSTDASGANLMMRYTARTRSIAWRKDDVTTKAVTFLQELLEKGDPLMHTIRLEAGQGVLCNNALHNRTGFDPDPGPDGGADSDRLIFRVRFHNRVDREINHGQTQ